MTLCKRSSSTRSSAAIIGSNDDLLMEILLFLPAKSLVRFKLVSKHWRSLISAPSFSRLHILHHPRRRPEPQHSFILGGIGGIELRFFVFHPNIRRLIPFRFGFPFVKIMQSCNGLLLLRCRNTPSGRKDYYVCNPTTMQSRNLMLTSRYIAGLCLIFDPSVSPHYKVVCFTTYHDCTSFLVYHSETHEWMDGGESSIRYKHFRNGVHLNDAVYFVRFRYESFRYIPDDDLSFIPTPPRIQSPGAKKSYTMESNGLLHQLTLSLKPDKNLVHVYVMEEIERGWSKKYRVDINPILSTLSRNGGTDIELLGMIRGEMKNDAILLFHVPGKIISYRFGDKVCEVLVDFGRENYFEVDHCNLSSRMLTGSLTVLLLFDLFSYDGLAIYEDLCIFSKW